MRSFVRMTAVRVVVVVSLVLGIVGCASDNPTSSHSDPVDTTVARGSQATVASVAVSLATASLHAGEATQATAVARDASGNVLAGRAVTWSTTNPSIATVDSAGLVKAIAGPASPSITASIDGVSGTASLAILADRAVPVASVTVTLNDSSLNAGATAQATAVVRDSSGNVLSGRTVVWSSSDSLVASIDGAGSVRARKGGTTAIVANVENVVASVTLTVAGSTATAATVDVSLLGFVSIPGSARAVATVRDAAHNILTDRVIQWSSSNPSVASVDATGLVSAMNPGSVIITATVDGISGQAPFEVAPLQPCTRLNVQLATNPIAIGQAASISANPTDDLFHARCTMHSAVLWTSSDNGIATVASTGTSQSTATGVAGGTSVITASMQTTNGPATSQMSLVVSPATPVASVGVFIAGSVKLYDSTLIAPYVQDAQGNELVGRPVTLTSSNPGVATIDANHYLHAVGVGTATITATVEGKSGTATATVVAVSVATISIMNNNTALKWSQNGKLTAVLKDASGYSLAGPPVTWSTSDPSILTVASDGPLVARDSAAGWGTVTVTGSVNNVSASLTMTIPTRQMIDHVTVLFYDSPMHVGASQGIACYLYDAAGGIFAGPVMTFASSNTAVATVDSTPVVTQGMVTAVSPGTSTISCTSEGKGGSALLTVVP